MTYRQLQAQLKAYRANGYNVPRLNSKKEVLETALYQIEMFITLKSLGNLESPITAIRKNAESLRDQVLAA